MRDEEKVKKVLTAVDDSGNDWKEKAEFRRDNRDWLQRAGRIALIILRILREKGMSQADLARSLSVSPQQVAKLVKGRENLTLKTLEDLNKALGVDLYVLLSSSQSVVVRELSEPEFYELTLDSSYDVGEMVGKRSDAKVVPLVVYKSPGKVYEY